MATNEGKAYLVSQDIERFSIWKFDDSDDLTYPVCCSEDFPENSMDLRIRANFLTSSGIKLSGFIVGMKNIFCITIFCRGRKFILNKNLLDDCKKYLIKLSKLIGVNMSPADFSPLKYKTGL